MLLAKKSIAISDMKFSDNIINKNLLCVKSLLKMAIKQAGTSFWKRFGFIYAFPILIIKRNTFAILHNSKIDNIIIRTVNQTQPNTSTQQFPINNQILFLQNNLSPATLSSDNNSPETNLNIPNENNTANVAILFHRPPTTLYSSKIPSKDTTEKENIKLFHQITYPVPEKTQKNTFNIKTQNVPNMNAQQMTIQNLKTNKLHTIGKNALVENPPETTLKRIIIHPKTFHSFTDNKMDQLNASIYSLNAQDILIQNKFRQNKPETIMIQRNATDFGSYEQAPAEQVMKAQPRTRGAMAEQVDELISPKVREKAFEPDLNGLADKICQLIERKAKIERERRG